ncbi:MAG TPA: hypothetical protein VLL52_19455 [Anaerolineae bacterium]|nr:hypothetical protein [Anaerolineae bacterium]
MHKLFTPTATTVRRYWPLIIIVWLVNQLTALVISLPLIFTLHRLTTYPLFNQFARHGLNTDLIIDTLATTIILPPDHKLDIVPPAQDALIWLLLLFFLIIPLTTLITGAFIRGGILLTYHEQPHTINWRRFLWACWHWWFFFLAINTLQLFIGLFFALSGLIFASYALFNFGPLGLATALLLLLLPYLQWLIFTEGYNTAAITTNSRNPLTIYRHYHQYRRQHSRSIFTLYLSITLLLLTIHFLYRFILRPIFPDHFWPLIFFLQTLFIITRLSLQLGRYAATTHLQKQLP